MSSKKGKNKASLSRSPLVLLLTKSRPEVLTKEVVAKL